jgi:hypothetical protein
VEVRSGSRRDLHGLRNGSLPIGAGNSIVRSEVSIPILVPSGVHDARFRVRMITLTNPSFVAPNRRPRYTRGDSASSPHARRCASLPELAQMPRVTQALPTPPTPRSTRRPLLQLSASTPIRFGKILPSLVRRSSSWLRCSRMFEVRMRLR